MALGRPADALRHFEAVTRLRPGIASAWFNEAVALEALGRTDAAAARYAEALKRQPDYSAALNNLGALCCAPAASRPHARSWRRR